MPGRLAQASTRAICSSSVASCLSSKGIESVVALIVQGVGTGCGSVACSAGIGSGRSRIASPRRSFCGLREPGSGTLARMRHCSNTRDRAELNLSSFTGSVSAAIMASRRSRCATSCCNCFSSSFSGVGGPIGAGGAGGAGGNNLSRCRASNSLRKSFQPSRLAHFSTVPRFRPCLAASFAKLP